MTLTAVILTGIASALVKPYKTPIAKVAIHLLRFATQYGAVSASLLTLPAKTRFAVMTLTAVILTGMASALVKQQVTPIAKVASVRRLMLMLAITLPLLPRVAFTLGV